MSKGNQKLEEKLSLKKNIFGVLMIVFSLAMIYYGFSLGFETSSSFRFILAGLLIFVLAAALFKNMINSKPIGIVFVIYLILDLLISAFSSVVRSTRIISEIAFLIVAVCYIFFKKKK